MPKKLTKKEAQDWLDQNHPKYKILEWGGSGAKKTKFIDTERGVEFEYGFCWLRSKLKKDSFIIFSPTEKEKREKIRQTNLKKYGNACSLHGQQVKEKVKKTWMERWGVDNTSKSEAIKKKKEQTCFANFGHKTNLQNKDQIEKIRQTNLEKYGSEYNFQSEETKRKIRESRIKSGNIIAVIEGKTLSEWSPGSKLESYTLLLKNLQEHRLTNTLKMLRVL